jgi:uncharacterized protein
MSSTITGVGIGYGRLEGGFMKAALVLVIIYIGAFLIAIQGVSQGSAQAPTAAQQPEANSIDSGKETDIRSLLELVGARDAVQDAANRNAEQFRETLSASVPDNDRGQKFVNAFAAEYQQKLNPDEITGQLVAIYDKHFTDDEIKGLLQFYGSPLGQRFAAEMPKINAEILAANRVVSTRIAKDVLKDVHQQYPGITSRARFNRPRPDRADQGSRQLQTQPQAVPTASRP